MATGISFVFARLLRLMHKTYQDIATATAQKGVTLIAVSKTHSPARILEVYGAGQRHFGENRVQELVAKQAALPPDIHWHLIGHLQTNKVRQVVPFVYMIHSIDSFRLLQEVDKAAEKVGRVIDCLLQFHIAQEESKFGFNREEAEAMLGSEAFSNMAHVRICGVMGMATFTEDEILVKREFSQLKHVFEDLKARFFSDKPYFREISMGMSGDWEIAVAAGSTMVRVGSLIFGQR